MHHGLAPLDTVKIEELMWDIREQEAAQTLASLIDDRKSVLNIGPSWGRDFYYLSRLGKQVINADIAPQYHLDQLVLCDVAKGLPFPSRSFDVVLLAEVLEHLVNDAAALTEARRVVRDDGILVISVPFYNDQPEFHVRIHSPRTIQRLLRGAGFNIVIYLERGGIITWARAVHAARKILRPLIRPDRLYGFVIRLDHFLAQHWSRLLKASPYYGCYIVAKKGEFFDYQSMNVNEFRH